MDLLEFDAKAARDLKDVSLQKAEEKLNTSVVLILNTILNSVKAAAENGLSEVSIHSDTIKAGFLTRYDDRPEETLSMRDKLDKRRDEAVLAKLTDLGYEVYPDHGKWHHSRRLRIKW